MTTLATPRKQQRILLRSCPRCHGDLFPEVEDRDVFGCLQCGRRFDRAQLELATAPALEPAAA